MTISEAKKSFILTDADFLNSFFKEGWVILGTEEKMLNDLKRTEYTMGHSVADQSTPEDYREYCRKCKDAGI